jgi:hypothetical protein
VGKLRVRGVGDGVHFERRDVCSDDFELRHRSYPDELERDQLILELDGHEVTFSNRTRSSFRLTGTRSWTCSSTTSRSRIRS